VRIANRIELLMNLLRIKNSRYSQFANRIRIMVEFISFCFVRSSSIEDTTGPLSQGIANAIGIAIAAKNLASTYNRPGYSVIDNMTHCIAGHACLQEGVGLEAISLAGHLKLNNLVLIFYNNNVIYNRSAIKFKA
jgi:transketolase